MKHVSKYKWGPSHIPWTVVGKGQSFQSILDCSPPGFRIGINHVVCEIPVNIAIVSDLEVVRDIGPYLEKNAQALFILDDLRFTKDGRCVDSGIPTVGRTDLTVPMDYWNKNTYWFSRKTDVEGNETCTAEAAAQLILNNVPDLSSLFSVGCDGGDGYHRKFVPAGLEITSRPRNDFDRHKNALRDTLARYGRQVETWGQ